MATEERVCAQLKSQVKLEKILGVWCRGFFYAFGVQAELFCVCLQKFTFTDAIMFMENGGKILTMADYSESQIVLYQPNETLTIEVKMDAELNTVWLSIDQMAMLLGRDKSVVGKHVRAIFKEGELQKESVWAKFAYTPSDGKTYQVDFYNNGVIYTGISSTFPSL